MLGDACERFNWACHAYCLMSNHYHLLIETREANLALGMRHLNGVYTLKRGQGTYPAPASAASHVWTRIAPYSND